MYTVWQAKESFSCKGRLTLRRKRCHIETTWSLEGLEVLHKVLATKN